MVGDQAGYDQGESGRTGKGVDRYEKVENVLRAEGETTCQRTRSFARHASRIHRFRFSGNFPQYNESRLEYWHKALNKSCGEPCAKSLDPVSESKEIHHFGPAPKAPEWDILPMNTAAPPLT